jgi:ABC-type nitrate/sulfonate/bicarbonate transport system substrate-binding protein
VPTVKLAVVRTLAGSVAWGMEPFAAKQGIRVEPVTGANYAEMQRHLAQGVVDTAQLGYQNIAILADQGIAGIKVVAGSNTKGQNLVVRKGSGIQNWPDLKGKKIGIVQGSYAAILFQIAARLHGVDPETINLVSVTGGGTTEIKALKDGQLDGYVIWAPLMERAVIQGAAEWPKGIDIGDTEDLKDGNGIIAATQKFVQEGATLDKFLKAYVETLTHYRQNPSEWAALATQVTGADIESVTLAVKNIALDYKLVKATLVGVAKYGPQFGYTKRDVRGQVESYVDLGPLARALGVNPQRLWE